MTRPSWESEVRRPSRVLGSLPASQPLLLQLLASCLGLLKLSPQGHLLFLGIHLGLGHLLKLLKLLLLLLVFPLGKLRGAALGAGQLQVQAEVLEDDEAEVFAEVEAKVLEDDEAKLGERGQAAEPGAGQPQEQG